MNDWYHTYNNDVYNYVFLLIRDHEQAKDILQDTFLRAYNNYESFQGGLPKAWLFRIARNLAIDHFRKRKPIAYFLDSIPFVQTIYPTPEQMTLLNESEQELYIALSKLKRLYREVIILRKIKEFSIKETSTILGWSESKVKVNLYRGIQALKKELEKGDYIHEPF
ncbi:RNA polymerase sigma factor [Bacillus sp. YZJH907-2]|uniref:RNA polymerase sigma factor n=1 Tax=Halalkalibacter suaedae TaxID=2822140 RepID=A0A941ATH6_9BACI|nr:RNA polymerase sigma factor [Bacillus suaedae]